MDRRRRGGSPCTSARLTVLSNWRVHFLAGFGFLLILGGLLVLALPNPYEGAPVYTLDPSHTFSQMDLVGLGLVILGGGTAWWAGKLWQQWMKGAEVRE